MKSISYAVAFIVILFLTGFQDYDLNGWKRNDPKNSYEIKIEKASGQDGKSCATIKSKHKKSNSYASVSQSIKAEKYLHKKIRLTGYIRTQDVKGSAHFWMRVDDGKNKIEALTSDAMYDRPVRGNTD